MLFTQENSRGLSRAKQSVLSTELFNKLLLNLLYSTLLYFLVEVYPAGGCGGGGLIVCHANNSRSHRPQNQVTQNQM